MEFSFKDTLRAAVEINSNGLNTVMYDVQGNPNVMVRIPAFTCDILGVNSITGLHPAFILDDNREISEIWVSKYKAVIGEGGVPISVPRAVAHQTTFQDAKTRCRKKGRGWHLLTNFEAAAFTYLARAQMTGQRNAKHKYDKDKRGWIAYATHQLSENGDLLTGCDDKNFSHDNSESGIRDWCAIAPEYVDGAYISDGACMQIYSHGEDGRFQNRFYDDKYIASDVCVDTDTYNAPTNIGIDNNDGNYTVGPFDTGEAYYCDLLKLIKLTSDNNIYDKAILLGVYPTIAKYGNTCGVMGVKYYSDAKTKLLATRSMTNEHDCTQDVDFIRRSTDNDICGYRAVYIEY